MPAQQQQKFSMVLVPRDGDRPLDLALVLRAGATVTDIVPALQALLPPKDSSGGGGGDAGEEEKELWPTGPKQCVLVEVWGGAV